ISTIHQYRTELVSHFGGLGQAAHKVGSVSEKLGGPLLIRQTHGLQRYGGRGACHVKDLRVWEKGSVMICVGRIGAVEPRRKRGAGLDRELAGLKLAIARSGEGEDGLSRLAWACSPRPEWGYSGR